jgi:hypothetical protein
MEGIIKDIQVLVCERLMGTATEAQVKEIEEAIKQMDEMPSSFQDETGGVIQTNRDGDNFANVGLGTHASASSGCTTKTICSTCV